MTNVNREEELYAPMCQWLQFHLEDKYRRHRCRIIVADSHSISLDRVLTNYGLIEQYPQAVGLSIQIDVLGMVIFPNGTSELYFIEAKINQLNLQNLGQLWAYCKLCDPAGAWLLSSAGLGSLSSILINHHREDMLDFGDGKIVKKMIVGKWDVNRNALDNYSVIPKL